MSSAVHSDRAKEQIACKVFIQCIKHTAAQSKLSVPLYFNLRNRSSVELIQSMKKTPLPLLASGGTTHRPRTYSLQGSAVPAARKAAALG